MTFWKRTPTWALHEQADKLEAEVVRLAKELADTKSYIKAYSPAPPFVLVPASPFVLVPAGSPFQRKTEKRRIKVYTSKIDHLNRQIAEHVATIRGMACTFTPNELREMNDLPPVKTNEIQVKITADTGKFEGAMSDAAIAAERAADRIGKAYENIDQVIQDQRINAEIDRTQREVGKCFVDGEPCNEHNVFLGDSTVYEDMVITDPNIYVTPVDILRAELAEAQDYLPWEGDGLADGVRQLAEAWKRQAHTIADLQRRIESWNRDELSAQGMLDDIQSLITEKYTTYQYANTYETVEAIITAFFDANQAWSAEVKALRAKVAEVESWNWRLAAQRDELIEAYETKSDRLDKARAQRVRLRSWSTLPPPGSHSVTD